MNPLRCFYFLIAVAITVGSATLHGRLVGRWTSEQEVTQIGEQLAQVPDQIEEWEMTSSAELPQESIEQLACAAHQFRTYRHRVTGEQVDMILILGPPGPTSVHIPEVCYPSQNFKLTQDRERLEVPTNTTAASGNARSEATNDSASQFWRVMFEANDVSARRTEVCYGWTTDGTWQAPDQPRFHFAGSPWLIKIQVSASRVPLTTAVQLSDDPASTASPCGRFLQSLVPALRPYLQRGTTAPPPDHDTHLSETTHTDKITTP